MGNLTQTLVTQTLQTRFLPSYASSNLINLVYCNHSTRLMAPPINAWRNRSVYLFSTNSRRLIAACGVMRYDAAMKIRHKKLRALHERKETNLLHCELGTLSHQLNSKVGLSAKMVLSLVHYFDTPPQLWLNLQKIRNFRRVKIEAGCQIAERVKPLQAAA